MPTLISTKPTWPPRDSYLMERGHPVRLSAQREQDQSGLCHELERALSAGGQDVRAPSTLLAIPSA